MTHEKGVMPKRRDRPSRIMIDYHEAEFHQQEEIIKVLKEIRDLLKKALKD